MVVSFLYAFGGTLLTLLLLDILWLQLIAKKSYMQAMAPLLRERFHTWPWITFYLIYCLAIVWLVVLPGSASPAFSVVFSGAILGMAAYGTYNLTCYAVLNHWPLSITLKDWAWGTLVTAIASLGGWAALREFVTA